MSRVIPIWSATRAGATSWAGLMVGSALLTILFTAFGIPAAILIGPMMMAIVYGVLGSKIRLPRTFFVAAQGVIGCMIAGTLTPDVLREVARDWPAMMFGVAVTVAASTSVGWVTARFGSLPGTSAAWGSSPGAASAMVGMAAEFGADPRLVAAMQYIRVICVVLAASVASRALADATPSALPVQAAAEHDAVGVLAAVAVALGGSWLGRRMRIPAGGLLVPLAIGALVNASGLVHLATPGWLLTLVYAAIGWSIGLQFEGETLRRSLRALPEIVAASLATIALCGLAAFAMVRLMGLGGLTAFLATSPGGIDTVAIIAVSGGADTPFVMALQTLRVLVVVLTGPPIARMIARTARPAG